MADTDTTERTLTSAQTRAIAALLAERDTRHAAAASGVSERQLHRWQRDPAFVSALREHEAELIAGAMRRLLALQQQAADVIAAILSDPNAPASVRLRAALGVMDTFVRLRQALDLEQRVAALERPREVVIEVPRTE